MADKKDLFGGFDALSSMLMKDDSKDDVLDLLLSKDDDDIINEPPIDLTPSSKKDVSKKKDDDEPIYEPSKTTKDTKKQVDIKNDDSNDEPVDSTDDTLLEEEGEISEVIASQLAEKLGVTIPEDYEISKFDDVVSLLVDIVKTNSKPEFANEEVEKFNKFVEQGGDLRKFYDEVFGSSINVDILNIDKETDQKEILRQHLTNQGYKEERITRAINRYEEAGVLKDEAEEALELVKEFNKKKAEKLLVDQENFSKDQEKAKQIFVDTVYDTVKGAKDIRGIELSETEKKELLDYMFKTDAKGLTPLQKDYQDPKKRINNIIESAYFMKYGDKLINKNKQQGANDAYKALRETLKAGKGKRSAGSNASFDKASKPLKDLSSLLIG